MSERLGAIDRRIVECLRELEAARSDLVRIEGEGEGLRRAEGVFAAGGVKSEAHVRQIKDRLVDNHHRLISARRVVVRLEGELDGLKIAREIVGGDQMPPDALEEPLVHRGREISPAWRMILGHFLQVMPAHLSIDDVMSFVAQHDLRISRNAVRSQLHLYVNRGFLRRVGDGHYKATDAVKRLC